MSQIKEAFGRRLKKQRIRLGYTQQEMAYAVGIQWSRYHKYELGRNEPPFDILVKLAKLTD
jgi:DNA-binding XRE family transcriptional regulator